MKIDRIDLKILDLLQHDATMPVARIADRVGLSQTPCWKRIQKYEGAGLIKGRVALLDPDQLGLGLTAFVFVEAADPSPEWHDSFIEVVGKFTQVCDIFRLAGDHDYMLRVVVADMAAYDSFYASLTAGVRLRAAKSVFAMERVKVSTGFPLQAMALT